MRAKLVNGGVFFRSIPGDFMNGYEAQLFNGCYENDPAKPARFSTGAIDDRQLARRLVSRDLEPLVMTVIAAGPHLATWVTHDLSHVGQVARVMARQYAEAVGPWRAYLSILDAGKD